MIVVDALSNCADVEIMESAKSAPLVSSSRRLFAAHLAEDVIVCPNEASFGNAERKKF